MIANGFPAPRQCELAAALADPHSWPAPLIVKPVRGSASVGVRRIDDRGDLIACARAREDLIVQTLAPGEEYTVHVYVDGQGRARCAVPCKRLEVRAGEVSKALTVKDAALMRLASGAAEALPGARGPLNIQIFKDGRGTMQVIEINARFGGGYPLADRAGGKFARRLIEEHLGLRPGVRADAWQDGLAMLRFDDAFFTSAHDSPVAHGAAAPATHPLVRRFSPS